MVDKVFSIILMTVIVTESGTHSLFCYRCGYYSKIRLHCTVWNFADSFPFPWWLYAIWRHSIEGGLAQNFSMGALVGRCKFRWTIWSSHLCWRITADVWRLSWRCWRCLQRSGRDWSPTPCHLVSCRRRCKWRWLRSWINFRFYSDAPSAYS